jgi:hypothetical protein
MYVSTDKQKTRLGKEYQVFLLLLELTWFWGRRVLYCIPLTLMRMTKDEKGLAFFKGLLL